MISGDQYSVDMNTRFKFPILRSDLCDYSDAYILCAVVAIICYGYTKHKSEQKSIDTINIKMENNNNLRKLLLHILRALISIT